MSNYDQTKGEECPKCGWAMKFPGERCRCELEHENAALRERLHNADAEIDMWASRCAAAIWMLPEQVTGGQLREAQDKFHRMLHAARKGRP